MNNKNVFHFKYLTLLTTLYVTVLLTSVLLDYRFVSLGPMLCSSATFIISITFVLSDVITEVYGYRYGRQVVWSGTIGLLCVAFICFLSINLPSYSKYAEYAHAYDVILHLLLRASIANAIAIAVGSFLNIYFLSKWKMLVKGKYFWLRSLGSSAIGQSLYTIFVVSLVNIGLVDFWELLDILIISYSYKLLFDTVAVFPASFLANYLKRTEGVDIYDFPVNLTPFKYSNVLNKNETGSG